ncbi:MULTISPECIES: hypothetical protein [Aeromonas]|uniref:Lipoprotein n=1 Tax=Aeromonas sanarellii TaxID=633415 RepID=A0ABS4B929_9GAMM|nr:MULTISPECIES: hypothetical protein [Aeromonas]MBP0603442.1 hypothetical protein [Aeromonas sanarellii]MEB6608225.1 hypothetical protein [Aeromonas sanarellii]QXC30867.1 hypothetical protein I6L39_03905 [Aeromonas sp. FDAARGOS 1409]QXW30121.1 hypothetical protein KXJ75_02665 [Aeromonas sanarellii]WOX48864.1 hypothetical protein R2B70_02365 [Aeromonas sp. XH]
MDKRILMVLLGILLSGCASGPVRVHGADFSVDDAHIRVTDGYHRHYYRHYDDHYYRDGYYRRDYYDHHHGGYRTFCPPGQAKKGRC